MKLVSVLICLLLDQFSSHRHGPEHWAWYPRYAGSVAAQLRTASPALRFAVTLGLPLLGAWLVLALLCGIWRVLAWIAGVVLLFICFGPRDLRPLLADYLKTIGSAGDETTAALARQIAYRGQNTDGSLRAMMQAIVVAPCDRVFAVVFWFVLLGPLGALAYRLIIEQAVTDAAADAGDGLAQRSARLLLWAPARLLALAYAVAGSLTHAFDRWDVLGTLAPRDNEHVLIASGLGSLQFANDAASGPAELRATLEEAEALVRRSFAAALIVLALLTLAGWL